MLVFMGDLIVEFEPPHEADERMFRMLAAGVYALAANSGCDRMVQ